MVNLKKLSFAANRAIFTYSELYAFGKSENLLDEGIFPKDSSRVTAAVNRNLVRLLDGIFPRENNSTIYAMTLAKIYEESPLSDETFENLKAKYISNLRRVVDLQTRLKEDSSTNSVVELTAAPVDFDAIDEAAARDEGLQELIAMLKERRAEGFTHKDIKSDAEFQKAACEKFGNFLENLQPGERQSIDIPCEVVIGEDGNKYWVPENREILAEFFGVAQEDYFYEPKISKPVKPITPAVPTAHSSNDKWLIYWYVCGTDIESDRPPVGDVTRCIRELEVANWNTPNVEVYMQAGGTKSWFHEKFQQNNGQVGRYVYSANERNWQPREMFPINSSNPSTLMCTQQGFVDFLSYGRDVIESAPEIQAYKNAGKLHRVLIFVDHGGGSLSGVCTDAYGSGDNIDLIEMRNGFENVFGKSDDNPPFELVAFDTCLMSTYETAVALEGAAKYMVASQEVMLGKVMLEYTGLINGLTSNPAMSGARLGQIICDTYEQDCKNNGEAAQGLMTFSVIDISKIPIVDAAYQNFGTAAFAYARENPDSFLSQFSANANTSEFYPCAIVLRKIGGYPQMVDLKHFAEKIQSTRGLKNDEVLARASENLIKAIDYAVIYNKKRGKFLSKGGGLSTYYPYVLSPDDISRYENLANYSLTPHSQSRLYSFMLRGTDNEATFSTETANTDTNTPNPKQVRGGIYDLSDLSKLDVSVYMQSKTLEVELDEDQMNRVSSVRCQLMRVKVMNGENGNEILMLFYGANTNITSDWDSGEFTSTFGGDWIMINNQPVWVNIVSEATENDEDGNKIGGSELYAIPVQLNNNLCLLLVSREYPSKKFSVLGATPFLQSSGIPTGEFYEIKASDEIKPVYFGIQAPIKDVERIFDDLEKDPEDMTLTEKTEVVQSMAEQGFVHLYLGNAIRVGNGLNITEKTLPDGHYAYAFEFVNPTGGENAYAFASDAVFVIKNGKLTMRYSDELEEDDLKD